jgi:proteasome lid subunit RPN8/RPN11
MQRALMAAPHEVCGFILKDGTVIEIPNSAIEPHNSFAMSRRHLNERVPNPQLIEAIWHTHPGGSVYPSPGDQDYMAVCDWRYFIVTSRQVVEYRTKVVDWAAFSA